MNSLQARSLMENTKRYGKTYDYKVFDDDELNAVIGSIEKDIERCAAMGRNFSYAKLSDKERKMKDLTLSVIMHTAERYFKSQGFTFKFDGKNLFITW